MIFLVTPRYQHSQGTVTFWFLLTPTPELSSLSDGQTEDNIGCLFQLSETLKDSQPAQIERKGGIGDICCEWCGVFIWWLIKEIFQTSSGPPQSQLQLVKIKPWTTTETFPEWYYRYTRFYKYENTTAYYDIYFPVITISQLFTGNVSSSVQKNLLDSPSTESRNSPFGSLLIELSLRDWEDVGKQCSARYNFLSITFYWVVSWGESG